MNYQETKDETLVTLPSKLANKIYDALVSDYEAKIKMAKANIEIYFSNPVGIGEHGEIIHEIDVHLATLADAEGKLNALQYNFEKLKPEAKQLQS